MFYNLLALQPTITLKISGKKGRKKNEKLHAQATEEIVSITLGDTVYTYIKYGNTVKLS